MTINIVICKYLSIIILGEGTSKEVSNFHNFANLLQHYRGISKV